MGDGINVTVSVRTGVFVGLAVAEFVAIMVEVAIGVNVVQLNTLVVLKRITKSRKRYETNFEVVFIRFVYCFSFSTQRLTLPAASENKASNRKTVKARKQP